VGTQVPPTRRSARLVAVAAQRAGPSRALPGQAPEQQTWVRIQSAETRKVGQDSTSVDTGRYPRLMRALGGVKLLILDDWGLEPLGAEQRHDMLEIVEERYGRGATLITSQIPVDRWHDLIGEPKTS
jgi:hypothetical protein